MNIAIIGCGLIGNKRAKCLGSHKLAAVVDTDLERAAKLASQYGTDVKTSNDWRTVASDSHIDAVIIATTPDIMPTITKGMLLSGKNVLVDKPAGRNARELAPVAEIARSLQVCARVGFNHRYHPALLKAHEMFLAGEVGEPMYIRAKYGHGGRLGYEQEWRANAAVSGGGELIDQGMHLIDLSRWFLGDFVTATGHAGTYYWNMPVDDNAFAMLKTQAGNVAWLHVSWTEWKNLFCFEFFGKTGKLQIDGLGGSYGTERLTFYKMKPELGPPDVQHWEFAGDDLSWQREFDSFISDIETGHQSGPNLDDAVAALQIAQDIYDASNFVPGVLATPHASGGNLR